MNLAVHGLEGQIAEAITYYQDEHSLYGKCDFVMANPPFNVDKVDAERIEGDPRLPFGLPGVNKEKKVSNGNYLWLSYFWSYLHEKGRAGCVMSSQASSAGHGEKEVRRKMVETGDVDVMVSIRSNFFYTRTVPCELWFFDRGKPKERRDLVLMLDARNVFRKVNRKINDFSPEQLRNLAAIVWLYRGQRDRFLALVADYFHRVCEECAAVSAVIDTFERALGEMRMQLAALAMSVNNVWDVPEETKQPFLDALLESSDAVLAYVKDRKQALKEIAAFVKKHEKKPPKTNEAQHAARRAFEPLAERLRGLVKQVDLLFKLTARVAEHAANLVVENGLESSYDRRAVNRLVKQLDDTRKDAVEQLKHAVYFHRQVAWLQDRFPNAELEAVPGLVRCVTRAEIAAADWSLTPGRYVGVAPQEDDEDFDFEETLRNIHVELADLNVEAAELAAKIQANFEELGI